MPYDVLRPPPVHPHMLQHACGFKLANDGEDTRALQEWLGHSNIQHTTRYTELTPKRFKSSLLMKSSQAIFNAVRAIIVALVSVSALPAS